MKRMRRLAFILAVFLLVLTGCSNERLPVDSTGVSKQPTSQAEEQTSINPVEVSGGMIYLYGEQHGVEKILDKELELWRENYEKNHMRHLFIEMPYYTAEFLNLWMQSDNDDLLEGVYEEWKGTASYTPEILSFYQGIKSNCPDTVFHGTDVGHQYDTTGERYLTYLEEEKEEDSEQYRLAQEAIEQGKYYYKNQDDVYRENKMAENFIREYNKLNGESIMGIYGGAHTGVENLNYVTKSVPCMANQLKEVYGDKLNSEDLSWLTKDIEPIRSDTIQVNHKEYTAAYYGKQDLTGFKDYAYREFWRLEDAYQDFKGNPKTGDILPYEQYPMLLNEEQVFVIDYTKTDNSRTRQYYRSDGDVWEGEQVTVEFMLPD